VFKQASEVRFHVHPRKYQYKVTGTDAGGHIRPPMEAEVCTKEDGVNSSASQAVTRRRSARPD
jgi:hypothetical protein